MKNNSRVKLLSVIAVVAFVVFVATLATTKATTIGANVSTGGNFTTTAGNLTVGDGTPTITLNGEDAYIEGTFEVDGASRFDGALTLTADATLNAQSDLRLADSDSSNYVALQAPSVVTSNVTWTLPNADGSSGQVLSTNGSGTLSWATDAGGSVGKDVLSLTASTAPGVGDGIYTTYYLLPGINAITEYFFPMTSTGTVSKIRVYTYSPTGGSLSAFPNSTTTTFEVRKNSASFATPALLTMSGNGATRSFSLTTNSSQTFVAGDLLSFKLSSSDATYTPGQPPTVAVAVEFSYD